MLAIIANTCHVNVLQVFYDQICTNMLRDTWFEVFGSKMPFLGVLDCPNSPRRVNSSLGELEGRTGGSARLLLAMASSSSPPQQVHSPRRVSSAIWCCLLVSGRFGDFRSGSFVQSFIKVNPSNQGPK